MRSVNSSSWVRSSKRKPSSGGIHLLAMLMLLSVAPWATGQTAKPETELLPTIRAAIKNGQTQKSRLLGFNIPKIQFEETPVEGALLIGFEIGLIKTSDGQEEICTLSPIYLTARGEQSYQTFGSFPAPAPRTSTKRPPARDSFSRMVRLKANPGYAVGGIQVHTAIKMHAMALTCMSITGSGLDPKKSYATEWVGNRNGGGPSAVSCDGAPIVGVHGHHDKQLLGLGLIFTRGRAQMGMPELGEEPRIQTKKTGAKSDSKTVVEFKDNEPRGQAPDQRVLPKPRKYRNDALHFSLTPATGWQSMSKTEFAAIEQFLRQSGMAGRIHYEGGLRPAGSRMGSYPYALLQFTPLDTRKTTYAEIQRAIGQDFSAPLQEIKGAIGDLGKNIAIGKPVLDRDNNRILLRMEMDVPMVGKVQALSVCHLGSEGIAAIHCYAFERDFERLLPSFTYMNDTFAFDDGFEFVANDKAQLAGAQPWKAWMPYVVFGAVALSIVLFSGLFVGLRRRPSYEHPDEPSYVTEA